MNKQFFCAAAFLWVGGACHAQPSITIYGLLDTAVEHINHVGATGSGLTRIPSNAGNIPSRLGFRGREDLGGGISAQFVLEMGIAPDSGVLNQGGRGFGRQSFVGLNGPWGQVSLGRQYTMLFWSMPGCPDRTTVRLPRMVRFAWKTGISEARCLAHSTSSLLRVYR